MRFDGEEIASLMGERMWYIYQKENYDVGDENEYYDEEEGEINENSECAPM
jgi:hypothetical protein